MKKIARPWMLVYTIFDGLLSVASVWNNVENQYYTIFIIWTTIYSVLVFIGNLIYSLDAVTPAIRKIWKWIFLIIIFGFILINVVELIRGNEAHNTSAKVIIMALFIDLAWFLPTLWAHYKIGYGKEANNDVAS